jgi:tetratricopeptide (TPR) repeat protein
VTHAPPAEGRVGGEGNTDGVVLCQVCGSPNPADRELCGRCHAKLMVLSGPFGGETEAEEAAASEEEGFSFDEHLLERVSILEEVVKRTADTVRQVLEALYKQERSILLNQTGLATIRELLEEKRVVTHDEWRERAESRMDYQMLALEKRDRFLAIKEKLLGLYNGDRRKQYNQLLQDAEYALFAFDLPRAINLLEQAFKLDRGNYELGYFLGETFFNEGDAENALAYFGKVLEARPDHYEALVYSGVVAHERGDVRRAEDLLKRAVARYPDSFLPHFSLGAVYAGEGNLARAVPYLEKATRIDPVPQAFYLLGSSLYEMGRLGPAIDALREAVRLDPGFEEAYHLLGMAYLDRHWNRRALAAFREAQKLNPKKLQYQDLVRFLSGHTGAPLPAVDGEARSWLERAERLYERGKHERALAAYRRALAADPDNPTLLVSYAMACLPLKKSGEVEAHIRRVLDQEPGEMLRATAYATLIEALRSEGRFREGNRVGKRMLEEGNSPYTQTIAYYEMAYNLAEMEEELDQALDYARRAVDLSPEELKQFPLAVLGWVHYKRRELDQAVECLARASEIGATSTTLTHLGMALLASGDEERAREVLARARNVASHSGALESKLMEFLKDSSRLHQRVHRRRRELVDGERSKREEGA